MHSGYSDKPINDVQSLSRKPVRINQLIKYFFQYVAVLKSISPMGKIVKERFSKRIEVVFKRHFNAKLNVHLFIDQKL